MCAMTSKLCELFEFLFFHVRYDIKTMSIVFSAGLQVFLSVFHVSVVFGVVFCR